MKTVLTHGFKRKSQVPDLPGSTPKPCPKCQDWFAAFRYEHVCDKCSRQKRSESRMHFSGQTGTGTPRAKKSAQTTRSRVPKIQGTALLNGVSFGCRYPREQQAEILPRDQDKRHPYNGNRPMWSGYCTGQCLCECHGPREDLSQDFKQAATAKNVSLGLQGRCDLERWLA